MTLTHLIPSLRRSLADPIDPRCWPAHTTASIDDVTVAGVSLHRLVDWCGTPCVHSTDAGCVVVARVESVECQPDGSADVWVDAELEHADTLTRHARLIGRVSTAHGIRARVRPARDLADAAELPADIRAGDLVAIPSPRVVALRDLHRGALHPERLES
ncbi:MAG TPA: hypothetical protein VN759_00820 [Pseudolysinimonas sp.]|nr:hypothetical protein [Pseudolysinimonas sp.]